MAEEHRHARRCGDLVAVTHLDSLIPGQGTSQRERQLVEDRDELIPKCFGTRCPVEVHEDRVSRGPFDERADRGTVE